MMLSKEFIESMSYTDFIGFINQRNVLPGGFSTLSRRINYSNINKNSNVLEIGCTTGFSIREIATLTKCRGIGIDISEKSILAAIYNQKHYSPDNKVQYLCQDAYKFKSNEKFSHIVVGAGLKFFPDQKRIINKMINLLNDGGFILASPFYVVKDIPQKLYKKAKEIFGINITTESYKEIMNLYNKFEIIYENRINILKETEEEIKYYAECTINRITKELNIDSQDIYNVMFNRLVEIKNMSNILRPFQEYSVLVLRYRKDIYPNRFIELF